MKDLQILANYVSLQKVKQVQIVTDDSSFKGKSRLFYQLLTNGDIKTDEEAQQKLYNGPNPESYRKLKYRLRQKLINTLFVVDGHQYGKSKDEKSEVNLIKLWAATEILTHRRLQGLSRRLQAQVLKTAIKLDRLDIAIPIAVEQRRRFGVTEYNNAKYDKFNTLVKSLTLQYNFQIESSEYYTWLASIVSHKLKYDQVHFAQVKNRLLEMRSSLSEINNFNSSFFLFNAIYYVSILDGDRSLKKSICSEALDYLAEFPDTPPIMHFSFKQKTALLVLEEGQMDSALTFLNELDKISVKPGSISWQFVRNYKSLIHFSTQNYIEAYKVTASIINNNKAFNNLRSTFKEHWYIKEAYLSFLIAAGRFDISKIREKFERAFRISRFMNEVPQPSKDKVGYNLSINIIQFYFIFLESDPIRISDKLESLKQYGFRYLKGKRHIRARTFIKLLQKLKNPLLSSKQIISKSKTLLKTLMEHPHDYSIEVMEREIIPYELQWGELINYLEKEGS
jgi:hypothetical protein